MFDRVRHQLSLLRLRLRRSLRVPEVVPGVRRHSVSSCSEYERCPRRYRYGYVDRIPEDRPVPASWRHGTVVHTALEAAYRAHADGIPLAATASTAIDALRAAWTSEGLPGDAEWRARSEQLVRLVLENDRLDADQILGIEQGFRAETDDGVRFGGYADLVLQRDATTIEIVDHKITRYTKDQDSLQNDPQLNLYGWFAQREWPWATRVLATLHYPVLDRTITVELTAASMRAAVARLTALAHQAETDHTFAPHPGPECSNCPWIARCPAHAKEPPHLTTGHAT